MRGAAGVRHKLASMLAAEVPRKVPLLRDVWELDASRVPNLEELVDGVAPDHALTSAGDTWALVINPRLLRQTRVDIKHGLPVYNSRYACRVFVWVKAIDFGTAIEARDNLAAAFRSSLLEYPNLDIAVRGDTGYRVHEDTYAEEFNEPYRLGKQTGGKGGKVWAGALLSVDVDSEEDLADGSTREPIGELEEVTVTIDGVGADQPLPPLPEEEP